MLRNHRFLCDVHMLCMDLELMNWIENLKKKLTFFTTAKLNFTHLCTRQFNVILQDTKKSNQSQFSKHNLLILWISQSANVCTFFIIRYVSVNFDYVLSWLNNYLFALLLFSMFQPHLEKNLKPSHKMSIVGSSIFVTFWIVWYTESSREFKRNW